MGGGAASQHQGWASSLVPRWLVTNLSPATGIPSAKDIKELKHQLREKKEEWQEEEVERAKGGVSRRVFASLFRIADLSLRPSNSPWTVANARSSSREWTTTPSCLRVLCSSLLAAADLLHYSRKPSSASVLSASTSAGEER